MSNKMSLMPNISIPRSRFPQEFNHSLDMFHGDVVPVDCFEVVPGDEFSYELSSLIRMSTPVLPIMGNISATVHAFFVPFRIIWQDAEKFYGDPSNHDKVSTITPVDFDSILVPNAVPYLDTNYGGTKFMYSVQDYLGKENLWDIYDTLDSSYGAFSNKVRVSALKERAYLQIWNDHFRPSLMVPPVLINKDTFGTNNYGTASFLDSADQTLKYPFKCLPGFKQYDYFTASTFSPQFNSTNVILPLGTSAPIVTSLALHNLGTGVVFAGDTTGAPSGPLGQNQGKLTINTSSGGFSTNITRTSLVADLSNASAATINQIRYAFQLQKYFERSNYGSRYFEILNAHYGITNPDSRLQRAERLGSHKFYINISQVVSTADTVSGANGQNLGNTGAVSCTGDKVHLFTKSFSEPGYVMVVITTKYDRQYSSGWLREDLKSNRFEFYSPEFANLGDQATTYDEIQAYGLNGAYNRIGQVFGYQEHWAEYRYRKNLVSGSMRVGKTFDVWTLADSFTNKNVELGYNFLKEDRSALARLLASGINGPDYFCDFHAKIIATRELPLYSIPGLIDHFGAL